MNIMAECNAGCAPAQQVVNPATIVLSSTMTLRSTTSGINSSVPASYHKISITKTTDVGVVNILLSDGSTYSLTANQETFTQGIASNEGVLPAYAVSSTLSATWKWQAVI